MIRVLTLTAILVLPLHSGHCAEPAATPAFEVASIAPSKPGTPEPPGEHAGMVQFTFPGGRFQANATTLKFLIEWAYGIQASQHSGGPAWLATDRYDIVAKAEGPATDDQMRLMARTLLADRFRLRLHHETRELSAYVFTLGKTAPKLFPPKDGEQRSMRIAPQGNAFSIVATRFSIAQLADTFSRQLGNIIVDQTGLKGDFDFTMELAADDSQHNPMDPSVLLSALREQLGLSLKFQKTPIDVLVIESAEKVTAGN